MKIIFLLCLPSLTLQVSAGNPFPRSPDLSLTPGVLCSNPTEFRYPEKIAYCQRDVNFWQKELVFINYRKIGFSLSGERSQYKVDHFIPLCLGGSNDISNLWPQYFTVSKKSDPLEPLACEALAKGRITQHEVIDLVMETKLDLTKLPATMKQLRRLNR